MRQAEADRALAYQMFQEGRGATGHAFLPLYFGDTEKMLSTDATGYFNAIRAGLGTPQEQYQKNAAIASQYQPMIDQARGTLGDVFSGNMTRARLGYLQPVQQARTAMAKAGAQGIDTALAERINTLNAAERKKGYTGTGLFAQRQLLNSTIGARQAAAQGLAGATLQNAMDTRGVQDQGLQNQLAYMNMPGQLAQQAFALQAMPGQQVAQNFATAARPFETFRMTPQAFQPESMPMVGADMQGAQIANAVGNFTKGLAQMYFGGKTGKTIDWGTGLTT